MKVQTMEKIKKDVTRKDNLAINKEYKMIIYK